MVLDVGFWFRTQRAAQAAADAAALAGAQQRPDDPGASQPQAVSYADKNGGGLALADTSVTDSGTTTPHDTLNVHVNRTVPGFFSRIASVDVGADAAARGFKPGAARWVAPITVRITHADLCGPDATPPYKDNCHPTYDQPTTLTLGPTGAPGAFSMLNLDLDDTTGTAGSSTLADWIENGYDKYLPLGGYFSSPGAKFNNSQIDAALTRRMADKPVLLFPVYDELGGTGSNATYHVVAWAAFHVTGFTATGTGGSISGWFVKTEWDGLESTTGDDSADLGVRSVALVK
jgi:hypothetical protein